ncbi:MAG: HypC/HybG/HupF family hydrogenase formation chaperone [Elusimicrobiales bacterium]|nr:HypC/HybG/HupF family hydrogenase formation chaperone [Elusimicrobiales bacterium]
MCLAVPGLVIKLSGSQAEVDFGGGAVRAASVQFVPQAKIGDYVLVHAGCAIQIVRREDALETLNLLKEIYG